MRKDLPRIYLDMDGVLCDFGAQIRKATGKSKEAWMRIDGRVKWDTVIDYPKFWENMPWNAPGRTLYNFVRKYDPHILSAYLEKTFDLAVFWKDNLRFEKLILDYDTYNPDGSVNAQVILIMPELVSGWEADFVNQIETRFNNFVQSTNELIEIKPKVEEETVTIY